MYLSEAPARFKKEQILPEQCFRVLGEELYNEEMKEKQPVKHTLISRKHVAESFEDFPETCAWIQIRAPAVPWGERGGLGGEGYRGRTGQDPLFSSGLASGLSLCPVSLEAMKSKSLFRQLIEYLFPKKEEIGQDLIDSGTENTFQIALW